MGPPDSSLFEELKTFFCICYCIFIGVPLTAFYGYFVFLILGVGLTMAYLTLTIIMHVLICIYSTGNSPTFFFFWLLCGLVVNSSNLPLGIKFAVFPGPSSCVGPFSLQVSEKLTDKVCAYRFRFVRIFVLIVHVINSLVNLY